MKKLRKVGAVSGIDSYVQRIAYSNLELVVSLNNIMKMHAYEVRQQETLFGRLFTIFSRRDPDRVEVDGMRLNKLYKLLRREPPEQLDLNGIYDVSLVELREMVRRAEQRLPKIDGSYVTPKS